MADTSLARYGFYGIQQEREEAEAERQKNISDITSGVASLWKTWSSEQAMRTKELLAYKPEGLEMDPEYLKKGFLRRSFTPAGGRVRPTKTSGLELEPEVVQELEGLQGRETFSQYFTDPLKKASKFLMPKGTETGATQAGISTSAQALAGIGALTGIYDIATNWEEYSKTSEGQVKGVQRGLQTVGSALTATGVGAGIGVPLTLGATLWDWLT